jgi:opacity protein-like surface antigen
MNAFSKLGLLLAVALVACAAVAASAQAVVINPAGAQINGLATEPTLNYGEQVVTCATGTATGTLSDPASDTVFVDVDFQEPCDLQPVNLSATADCANGEFTELQATDATDNLGQVNELHPGFECTVVVLGICTLTVDDQELPFMGGSRSANLLGEGGDPGDEAIDADVDVEVFNNNALCGPTPSGSGGFAGVYELDNPDISFDP